ncbi:RidA family protein [Roseateles sp.]|jgi:reactive intermediate/imine deaminase|uniref:RidA family protein n=1 Tax=Roseateles sp. TaxID=1971397 RepID=UPI0037CA896B
MNPSTPTPKPSRLVYLGAEPNASDRQPRPLSPAVRAGDFVYVSGQVPVDAEGQIVTGGIEAQTRQVMANLQAALALAGATLDDVCKTTIWLEDARDFGAFNRVYMGYFPGGKPARSTVESRLMIAAKVEIDAVAYCPV